MFLTGGLQIPVQVGPPTEYARKLKPWLFGLLLVQVALTIWYELFKFHLLGVFVQAVQIGIGYYAWVQDMNITLVCIFGVVCFINGVILTVMALVPICSSALRLNIQDTVAACFMPFGNLAGAVLARLVYVDWKKNQDEIESKYARMAQQQAQGSGATGQGGFFAGLFGGATGGASQYGTVGAGAATASQPLFSGMGFTLGGDPNLANARAAGQNAFSQGAASAQSGLEEGKAYGAAGIGQAQAYGAPGMAKAQATAGQAQSMLGGMFGGGGRNGGRDYGGMNDDFDNY